MTTVKGIYFYDGFEEPQKLADTLEALTSNDDLLIEHSHLGDITYELLDDIEEAGDDKDAVQDILHGVSVFYDLDISEYQSFNERVLLDKNQYLKGIL